MLFRMALAALHYNENSTRVAIGHTVKYPKYKHGCAAVRLTKEKPSYSKC